LKVIIQVPIDKELVTRLDQLADRQGISRAAVIRMACTHYLRQLQRNEQVQQYVEGYQRAPEESTVNETLAWLAAAELPGESWSDAPFRES